MRLCAMSPRARLETVCLLSQGRAPAVSRLRREMPSVSIANATVAPPSAVVVHAAAWRSGSSFTGVDRMVEILRPRAITIVAPASSIEDIAIEVLTRCQRFLDRRNRASTGVLFDALLDLHERMHDRRKAHRAAEHDRALDEWQWLLRLAPEATLELQLAALFHGIEPTARGREAGSRVELDGRLWPGLEPPSEPRFEEGRARRGGDRTFDVLRSAGVDAATASRVRTLISERDARGGGPERGLLHDAAALSFFSLASPSYADCFGLEQTRRKVGQVLARMSGAARRRLANVRLRDDVRACLLELSAHA